MQVKKKVSTTVHACKHAIFVMNVAHVVGIYICIAISTVTKVKCKDSRKMCICAGSFLNSVMKNLT